MFIFVRFLHNFFYSNERVSIENFPRDPKSVKPLKLLSLKTIFQIQHEIGQKR